MRVALAANADRRRIERELHDGPQQHLVALAANLQLARRLLDEDPEAARGLLDEMSHDVRQALQEIGMLGHRIYPPLLEAAGLATALRTSAAGLGVRTRIEASAAGSVPPDIAGAVYFSCLDVLELAGRGARVTITVRSEDRWVRFEVVADDGGARATLPEGRLGGARDRIEALGGSLVVATESGNGIRIAGSVPVSR